MRVKPSLAVVLSSVVAMVLVGLLVGLAEPGLDMIALAALAPVAIILGMRRPVWIFVAFLYAGSFKAVIPVPVDLTVALGVAVIFLLVVDVSRRGFPRMNAGAWLFCLVVLFVVAGLFWGGLSPYGIIKASRLATLGMLAFFGAAVLVRDEEAVFSFANAAMAIGAAMSAFAVVGGGVPDLYGRFAAFGSNTIALGRAAAITLAGAVLRMIWDRRTWWWAGPTAVLAMWALGGSGSRGPAVATVLALGGIAVYRLVARGAGRFSIVATAAGALASGTILWQTLPEASVVRFTSALGGSLGASILSRLEITALAADITLGSPITGIGTGQFIAYSGVHPYPHNMILELSAENGVLVAALMVAVVAAALFRSFRWLRLSPGFTSDFVMVATIVSIVNAMVSGDLNDNRFFYSVLAIALFTIWSGTRNGASSLAAEEFE